MASSADPILGGAVRCAHRGGAVLDPAALARLREYAALFADEFPQAKPARWAGLPARSATPAFAALRPELTPVRTDVGVTGPLISFMRRRERRMRR